MRETFGFVRGDRVRDTRTGQTGTVHLWDFDPREPDAAVGEVRWDELFGAEELDLVAAYLVPVGEDEPDKDTARFSAAEMAAIVGNVLSGRFPVDGRWQRMITRRGIDLADDAASALTIRTEGGQVFQVAVTEQPGAPLENRGAAERIEAFVVDPKRPTRES